jgi:hypothetical protein
LIARTLPGGGTHSLDGYDDEVWLYRAPVSDMPERNRYIDGRRQILESGNATTDIAIRKLGPEFIGEVFKIGRTIIGLQVGAGQREQAAAALPDLYPGVASAFSAGDELALAIREMIARLDRDPRARG